MMTNLVGEIAVVTGAGRGTGQAVALTLARAGARVAVMDVNPDAAQQTTDAINQSGGEASAYPVDVSNKMAIQSALYTVLEAWGKIDLLVNAAHITPSRPALMLDEWEWNRVVDVNLKGVFLASQTVARAMTETGGGVIVNIVRPATASAPAVVRATRDGILGLTAALAAEWAGIPVVVEAIDSDRAAETFAKRYPNLPR